MNGYQSTTQYAPVSSYMNERGTRAQGMVAGLRDEQYLMMAPAVVISPTEFFVQ